MPETRYRLRQMFSGLREGQTESTFFTRDTEHLIHELPEDRLTEAVSKGWIEAYTIPDAEATVVAVDDDEGVHSTRRRKLS